MASLALNLKSHPHKSSYTLLNSTIFSHLYFYSSSSNNNNDNFSSYLTDIKSKLKQQEQQQPPPPTSDSGGGGGGGGTPVKPYPFSTSLTDIKSKLRQHQQQQLTPNDEIRKNLSEFRFRASGSSPTNLGIGGESEKRTPSITNFEAIRESLKQMKMSSAGKNKINPMSFNTNLKAQPTMPDRGGGGGGGGGGVIGGSGLPMGVFGKEMKEKETKKGDKDGGETAVWMRPYNVDDLGKKLKELRIEGNGFSLSELNERLKKVKENDDKEDKARTGLPIVELRRSLKMMENEAKSSPKFGPIPPDILGPGLPSFMLSPPKAHLVEKYFHPDNMSSEEKLKLELKKVRDEFKMHESDCGSARVQIAQLTTEILHLSSVLHKKDKHSRRGLQAKVQQRKKLLKYLRRTDWDSYCFVLSKLGLRDNPDYKN